MTTWACSPHVADALIALQRDNEITEVAVRFRWETA